MTSIVAFQRGVSADPDADADRVRELESLLGGASGAERLSLLGEMSELLRAIGAHGRAVDAAREAIGLARSLGDDRREAANAVRLATALQYDGRHHESLVVFEAALHRTESGFGEFRHFVLQHMGKCLVELGQRADARVALEEALQLRTKLAHDGYLASTRAAIDGLRDTPIYDSIGHGYAAGRRQDPRIADLLDAELGTARTVLNVGAGAGSYEPRGRRVTAVEPSAVMRAQRPAASAPVIDASAESLPFDDGSFDAVMTVLSMHHWNDPSLGIREMVRVARERVVILTFDSDAPQGWLVDEYAPEIARVDKASLPAFDRLPELLGGTCVVTPVLVPADCTDEFLGAFWARPESYLDPSVRALQSGWRRIGLAAERRAIDQLERDLASGAWDQRHGALRDQDAYDCGYRLVVASLDHPA